MDVAAADTTLKLIARAGKRDAPTYVELLHVLVNVRRLPSHRPAPLRISRRELIAHPAPILPSRHCRLTGGWAGHAQLLANRTAEVREMVPLAPRFVAALRTHTPGYDVEFRFGNAVALLKQAAESPSLVAQVCPLTRRDWVRERARAALCGLSQPQLGFRVVIHGSRLFSGQHI